MLLALGRFDAPAGDLEILGVDFDADEAAYYLENRWLSDTTMISSVCGAHKKQSGILSFTAARQSDGIVVSGTWFFGQADSTSAESWATSLDADVSGRPVILRDFKTGEYWIAAADVYDNVYLLNFSSFTFGNFNFYINTVSR